MNGVFAKWLAAGLLCGMVWLAPAARAGLLPLSPEALPARGHDVHDVGAPHLLFRPEAEPLLPAPLPRLLPAVVTARKLPSFRRPPPRARPPRPRLLPPRLRKPPPRGQERIAPSDALRLAIRHNPGSMGLGVELLPGPRPVYAVKLKAGNRILRILVDAVTGRILDR
jgi:hypothetical protein